MDIQLIYGSDTGNTENFVDTILLNELESNGFKVNPIPVDVVTNDTWKDNTNFILGIPTWYDGELQSSWEDYFGMFQEIDFTDKTVAIFGLGDQLGYEEWFCDGIGILAEVVLKNGGKVIGYTENDDSYELDESPKSLVDENTFYGLCIDEDNQDELTEERTEKWVAQLKKEFNVPE